MFSHVYIHIYIHICMYVCMYVCIYIYIYIYICVLLYFMFRFMRTYVHACTCACTNACVCESVRSYCTSCCIIAYTSRFAHVILAQGPCWSSLCCSDSNRWSPKGIQDVVLQFVLILSCYWLFVVVNYHCRYTCACFLYVCIRVLSILVYLHLISRKYNNSGVQGCGVWGCGVW